MEIQLFNNPQFGRVRTAGTPEEPLFCLADICKAVDLVNPSQVKARLDPEDVQLIDLHALNGVSLEGNTLATFVNESGAYEVIIFSNSPKVRPFRRWLTKEVIPSIRKTGVYATDNFIEQSLADPDYAIRLLTELKEEREMRNALAEENKKQQALLEEQKPKVVFADAIVGGKTNILIRDLAKLIQQNGYEIGEKRLFIWLRENKYLTISNMPMQRYVEMGLFFVDEGSHSESGVMKCHFTTKVTPKGQQYFVNKFLGEN